MSSLRDNRIPVRTILLVLAVILALWTWTPVAAAGPTIPPSYVLMAESAALQLYVDPSTSQIVVLDKRNNKLWTSNPLPTSADRQTKASSQVNAVFFIDYADARREQPVYLDSISGKPKITVSPVSSGVSITYELVDLGLQFRLIYQLGDDYLNVTIPQDGIVESGAYTFVHIEPLPYFGATVGTTSGYFVVPDGPGARVRFHPQQPEYRLRYEGEIYGPVVYNFGQDRTYIDQANMPMYGEVADSTGFVAIVTQGASSAQISAALSDGPGVWNRIATQFVVRRSSLFPRRRNLLVSRIETEPVETDRQVHYEFLAGADASYVGIAKAYRQYLQEDRGVRPLTEAPNPLNLQFFMGIEKPAFPFPDFVQLTTFDQVIQILQDLRQRGVDHIDVTLVGWDQGGYAGRWPNHLPPDDRLGGIAGLERLAAYCASNGDRLILQYQSLEAIDGNSGFSTRTDVVRGANRLPMVDPSKRIYLLNTLFARDHFIQSDVPLLARWGVKGVLIPDVGNVAVSDYNQAGPLTRDQFVKAWQGILSFIKGQVGWVGVGGTNDYFLGSAGYLTDFPVERSNYLFFEDDIPLFPLVVHGLATYTSTPGNLRGDVEHDFLRQLEYGAVPTFELTYAPPSGLGQTRYNQLYSSTYSNWLDRVVQEYRLAKGPLGSTWTEQMVDHHALAPQVYVTVYQDGTRVVVNYGDQSFDDGTTSVPALGYEIQSGADPTQVVTGTADNVQSGDGGETALIGAMLGW